LGSGTCSRCARDLKRSGIHLVYRLYDYRRKPWFVDVERIEFERYETRRESEDRERYLIRTLHPRYNIQHKRHGEGVMIDQPMLPGMPTPPRRPFQRPPTSTGVRYSKITSKRYRDLCGDCTADIHKLGQEFAPYPKKAVWRRSDRDGAVLLCQAHKDERVAGDAH
jgi:hypothetical protein